MYKVCKECQAIWDGKKWFYDDLLLKKLKRKGEENLILCSACKRIRDGIVCGICYLESNFIKEKREEIEKLIRKEEELERIHNHFSRIFKIYSDNEKRLIVETINQTLAVHIGKKMKKMFGGHLKISGGSSGRHSKGPDEREEVVVKWWKMEED